MLRRIFVLGIAGFAATGAAVALYALGHDAMGISRHDILTDSVGSAAFLALTCAAAGLWQRKGN